MKTTIISLSDGWPSQTDSSAPRDDSQTLLAGENETSDGTYEVTKGA
jgi:hypothetical protein